MICIACGLEFDIRETGHATLDSTVTPPRTNGYCSLEHLPTEWRMDDE